jgi:hypothetical protein
MKLYHTSPDKEIKIKMHKGEFSECLFFSSEIYTMANGNIHLHSIEIDEDQIISVSGLYDEEIVSEIEKLFYVDTDTAENLLDGSESEWDYECDAEKSWKLQGLRGLCAEKMGYIACKDKDEQGTVYIVRMYKKENMMNYERAL